MKNSNLGRARLPGGVGARGFKSKPTQVRVPVLLKAGRFAGLRGVPAGAPIDFEFIQGGLLPHLDP
jgi:hypothetical protein